MSNFKICVYENKNLKKIFAEGKTPILYPANKLHNNYVFFSLFFGYKEM